MLVNIVIDNEREVAINLLFSFVVDGWINWRDDDDDDDDGSISIHIRIRKKEKASATHIYVSNQ